MARIECGEHYSDTGFRIFGGQLTYTKIDTNPYTQFQKFWDSVNIFICGIL